ncbi:MAG: WD40 repeat domain-containing protein [Phycisphaerae bacterium]|nr:WD40 repeat domain-containing protein [Phycisphaerae bacterium]
MVVGDSLCFGAPGGAVYKVNLVNGTSDLVWKRPPSTEPNHPHFLIPSIAPLRPGRVLVTFFFERSDPVRLIDLAAQSVVPLPGLPKGSWPGGQGNIASCGANGVASLWNIETKKRIRLPISSQVIEYPLIAGDEHIWFAALIDGGGIAVLDLKSNSHVATLVGGASARGTMQLSPDRTTLLRMTSDSTDDQGPPLAVHVMM